jgi:RNA polymerase sigma-70 factor (ECF subfamily)
MPSNRGHRRITSDAARVTRLLRAWGNGDAGARDELVPLVYASLRRLARHQLSDERHAATLQPTALVHEAYVRLVAQRAPDWQSRRHFYGVTTVLTRLAISSPVRPGAGQRSAASS